MYSGEAKKHHTRNFTLMFGVCAETWTGLLNISQKHSQWTCTLLPGSVDEEYGLELQLFIIIYEVCCILYLILSMFHGCSPWSLDQLLTYGIETENPRFRLNITCRSVAFFGPWWSTSRAFVSTFWMLLVFLQHVKRFVFYKVILTKRIILNYFTTCVLNFDNRESRLRCNLSLLGFAHNSVM